VVLPGISPSELEAMRNFTNSGLMQLLDMFSGGAFSQASIFALGIMPYITASIVIQLLGMVLPQFQKMQREGESGRMKLNQYTRYLTVLILLVQAPAYLVNLQYQVNAAGGHANIMGNWPMLIFLFLPSLELMMTATSLMCCNCSIWPSISPNLCLAAV
jgi:preprotein translocase subunit SecY